MDGQPMATPDDCLEAEAIARADPKVQALVRQRGINDFGMVACDPWCAPPPLLLGPGSRGLHPGPWFRVLVCWCMAGCCWAQQGWMGLQWACSVRLT
jgi:hypothetical protein